MSAATTTQAAKAADAVERQLAKLEEKSRRVEARLAGAAARRDQIDDQLRAAYLRSARDDEIEQLRDALRSADEECADLRAQVDELAHAHEKGSEHLAEARELHRAAVEAEKRAELERARDAWSSAGIALRRSLKDAVKRQAEYERHRENVRALEEELSERRSDEPGFLPDGWKTLRDRLVKATPRTPDPSEVAAATWRRQDEERQRPEVVREHRIRRAVWNALEHNADPAGNWDQQRSWKQWIGGLEDAEERAEAERRFRSGSPLADGRPMRSVGGFTPAGASDDGVSQLGEFPTLRP